MTEPVSGTILATVVRGAVALVPLSVLALALAFVAGVAVVRPDTRRQKMVGQLAEAIADLGAVIAGSDRRPAIRARNGPSARSTRHEAPT